MIPLAVMFARMAEEQQQADNDLTKFRMAPGAGPRPRPSSMPMRPPEQKGPEPPLDRNILARLFEAMK